jgi:hypothetical protein
MAIVVQIQHEDQSPDGDPWWHPRSTAVLVAAHPGTCCLRFIDPYGDATFNQEQIPVLIAELEAHTSGLCNQDDRAIILDLIGYVGKACDRVHMYVRFIGD